MRPLLWSVRMIPVRSKTTLSVEPQVARATRPKAGRPGRLLDVPSQEPPEDLVGVCEEARRWRWPRFGPVDEVAGRFSGASAWTPPRWVSSGPCPRVPKALHRRMGIISALFVILLSLSGLLLHHASTLNQSATCTRSESA